MPAEIGYKFKGDPADLLDAARKVADAFAGLEGGATKVSKEMRAAQKEADELGRLAKRIMEDAKTPAEKYAEQLAQSKRAT